jgi:hypothetical protein
VTRKAGPAGTTANYIGPARKGFEGMPTSTNSGAARVGRTTSRACGFARSFRAVFVFGLAAAMSYATTLLVVLRLYRKGYAIGQKSAHASRSAATNLELASLGEQRACACSCTSR